MEGYRIMLRKSLDRKSFKIALPLNMYFSSINGNIREMSVTRLHTHNTLNYRSHLRSEFVSDDLIASMLIPTIKSANNFQPSKFAKL